jgi:hypothetical protein
MGLLDWLKAKREQSAATRLSYDLNADQALIAQQVPELAGRSDVEGMAYVMQQIKEWNEVCSPDQAATFAGRLKASNEAWQQVGIVMPYWGNLWVLRTYQAELGMDVPAVPPPVKPTQ